MNLEEGYPGDEGNAFSHKVCSPVSLSPRRSYPALDSLLRGQARKPIVGWCRGQSCGCRLVLLHKVGTTAELIAQERCQFSTGGWLLVGWKFTEWCYASVDCDTPPPLVGGSVRSEEGRGAFTLEGGILLWSKHTRGAFYSRRGDALWHHFHFIMRLWYTPQYKYIPHHVLCIIIHYQLHASYM